MIVPLEKIKPHEANPRQIKPAQFKKLVQSLVDFPEMMEKRPLVVITHEDGFYRPLGGNMRLRAIPEAIKVLEKMLDALPARQMSEVLVHDQAYDERTKIGAKLCFLEQGVHVTLADHWNQEQRDAFMIKDNVSFGEWDWDVLANDWSLPMLETWGLDPLKFVPPVNDETVEDNYTIRPSAHTHTLTGDLYEIGTHRILCGDSTSMDAVATVMNGQEAALTFTSPPYWVGMEYETQKDETEIDEFIRRIGAVICCATRKAHGRIVINTGTASINRIDKKRKVEILPLIDKWRDALAFDGWLIRHMRIWMKNGNMPASISPKQDVIAQYNEYIIRFEQDENEDFSQVLTAWNPDAPQRGMERIKTPWAQQGRWDDLPAWSRQNVWTDVQGAAKASKHTAAFPVELPARNIRLYTKKGEIVFEPFCGSGTTLVAGEQHERPVYAIELSPAHTDTAVKRLVNWMMGTSKPFEVKRNGIVITKEPWLYE